MSENMKKLSEKEKVRRKISVWLGASNHIAVLHTVKELVGNSVDEVNKGNGDKIKIILHNNKTLSVIDNCQGLPINGFNNEGIENYKLLFETLFAGTKYENGIDNSDYTVGTNGVFNTVLTFSSQDITFEVARPDKNIYSISYHKGDLKSPLNVIGTSEETYTKITYTLDDDIFEENSFTFEELCEIANHQASLINGSIEVIDEENDVMEVFQYSNGINELLHKETEGMEEIHETISFTKVVSNEFVQEGKPVKDDMKIAVVMKYTKEDEHNTQIEFLNGSNLIHHGTIYDGMIGGLRNIINKYLKSNNMYSKDEKQITKEDISVGLNYIIDFKSYFPVFANQTKFASYVKYYEPTMKEALESFFESYMIENRNDMEVIAKQVLVNKQSREKAEKTRTDIKKKLSGTVNNLTARVDGFVNCKSKNKDETEFYIVEGKSALGSTKMGRDDNIQAIYAVRGKILNCLKASQDRIFSNDLVIELIKILGCGIEIKSKYAKDINNFNINNLRWSKIIIATDADVDGFHIRCLILTVIYALMPSLIYEGKVFIAESPLYEITTKKDESHFAYSDTEKDKVVAKLGNQVQSIQRSKGLGENTAEMMWETTMNPETRRLIKVVMPDDEKEVLRHFEMFLGDDLASRKEYIEEHLPEYIESALN